MAQNIGSKEKQLKEQPSIELDQEEFKVIQTQIANLNQQLSVAQAVASKEKNRSEELNVLSDRLQADFDNYRKRTAENNQKLKEDGIVDTVKKILPLMDTMRHAVTMVTDEKTAEGLKMVLKQFNDGLGSLGVAEIPALGEQFDPHLHDAVAQVKVRDASSANIIVEVLQKGYRLGERIIRHSVVKVGK
ncbi:MAG: nucleotide exchange factor GrpE [Firmicutes bacterium]|nr:nucleotide exchange factor GrpE [Bacillota bacterium]